MKRLEIISEKLTSSIGTPLSIIIHTFVFAGIFMLKLVGYGTDQILLILTTAVSLEAIYLAIFIQMSVNKTSKSLASVEKDIDEIQEDVDEIQEDVDDILDAIENYKDNKKFKSLYLTAKKWLSKNEPKQPSKINYEDLDPLVKKAIELGYEKDPRKC